MKKDTWTPTEIEKQRDTWFKERARPGMTFEEVMRLNDEANNLFPPTLEERRRKTESLRAMPEFQQMVGQ